jgi:hypothetical protein
MVLPFHWLLLSPFMFAALWLASYVVEIRPWFREGDVCPGVVVCENPLLVASLTDMTTDISGYGASYPAVRIREEPRRRFRHEASRLGSRVASIARYYGSPNSEHWDYFEPRAVQCATSDASEVARLLGEISEVRWAELEDAVRNLPQPFRPGLYRLWESRR